MQTSRNSHPRGAWAASLALLTLVSLVPADSVAALSTQQPETQQAGYVLAFENGVLILSNQPVAAPEGQTIELEGGGSWSFDNAADAEAFKKAKAGAAEHGAAGSAENTSTDATKKAAEAPKVDAGEKMVMVKPRDAGESNDAAEGGPKKFAFSTDAGETFVGDVGDDGSLKPTMKLEGMAGATILELSEYAVSDATDVDGQIVVGVAVIVEFEIDGDQRRAVSIKVVPALDSETR